MTEKQKNDVLYVCSLIETIARKTKNHRQDVIRHFTKAGIERQLRLAEVNHCLSFEQVSEFSFILEICLKIHENFIAAFGKRRGRNDSDRDKSLFKLENKAVISLTR